MKRNSIRLAPISQAKVSPLNKQDPIHSGKRLPFDRNKVEHPLSLSLSSSLMIQQRSNRPNSTYSTNSYQILLNAIKKNPADERLDDKTSLLSRQRAHQSSIGIQHGHPMQLQQQQQQLNPGLKQVNGKIHFESLSPPPLSHNTQANNNGTLLDTNVHIGITR